MDFFSIKIARGKQYAGDNYRNALNVTLFAGEKYDAKRYLPNSSTRV